MFSYFRYSGGHTRHRQCHLTCRTSNREIKRFQQNCPDKYTTHKHRYLWTIFKPIRKKHAISSFDYFPVLNVMVSYSVIVSTGTSCHPKSFGNVSCCILYVFWSIFILELLLFMYFLLQFSVQTDTVNVPSPSRPKILKNKAVLCRPLVQNKAISCKTQTADVEAQTGNYQTLFLL